jgi:hypothetical protein
MYCMLKEKSSNMFPPTKGRMEIFSVKDAGDEEEVPHSNDPHTRVRATHSIMAHI